MLRGHGELEGPFSSLIELEPLAVHQAMDSHVAARATKAVGQANLAQSFLSLGLRSIAMLELWEGKRLLELIGVASHEQNNVYYSL
jgi:hypothetical protein